MAETKTLNVRFQQKYDTAAEWAASNLVLLAGEIAVESDTGKFKFGDGEHTFKDLSYAGIDQAQLDAIEDNYYELLPAEEVTDNEALATVANPAKGDVAVVKRVIGGISTATSMTAYMYDGEKWCALDGNYAADNVYLPQAITLAGDFESIGNYNKGDVIAAGTSLASLFSGMLQQELNPTADLPSISISASGGSGEVGSSFTLPTATLKVDDVGSYTYGPATGIQFEIGKLKLAQGAVATATNYKTNAAIMDAGDTMTLKATGDNTLYTDSAISFTFNASGDYTQGAMPVTNLGNDYEDVRIAAGTATATAKTVNFTGYRYAFAGGTTAALDSATVRAASAKKSSKGSMDSQSEALNFTAAQGATKVFFAYPSSWTGTPYFEMFGLAWAENSNFTAKDNIQVADARGSVDGVLQGAVAYKLYAWELDTPLAAASTSFRVWFK